MFRFIHAADLHLDSPLKNLELHDRDLAAELRGATRQAFDNLIRLAIDSRVAFVLLAGDLFDGAWKDFNTGLFFLDRMRRLKAHSIRVFLVAGNHDAASRISTALRLPDNVHRFSSRRPESISLPEHGVVLHGRSYHQRDVRENLARSYPDPDPEAFNIGLLHTALTGRSGHEPYAPCSREELIDLGYEYWALGHVHQYEAVSRDPWIVFPGTIQGRHIRETGPGGAVLVQVEDGQVVSLEHRILDVVRWCRCRVDASTLQRPEQLLDRARTLLEAELGRAQGRSLAVRLDLDGPCPCFAELIAEQERWQEELAALALDCGDIWLEQVNFDLSSLDERVDPDTETPLDWICRQVDRQEHLPAMEELAPVLLQLAGRLPADLRLDGNPLPERNGEFEQLLAEARRLLLARISAR